MEVSDYRRTEDLPRVPHKKGKPIVKDETGEVICSCCGEVIEEKTISYGTGMKGDFVTDRNREHSAPMLTGAPTSTLIGKKDSYGKPVNKSVLNKLVKTDGRSSFIREHHTPQDTAIQNILQKQNMMKFKSDVLKRYKKAALMKLTQGRSTNSLIGAIICSVYKENGIPFTLTDMSKDLNMTKKELSNAYRVIYKEMGLSIVPSGADNYVQKIIGKFDMSSEKRELYSRKTSKLVEAYNEKAGADSSGKNPTATASAALYVVKTVLGDETLPQVKISQLTGTSTVTLRNRAKDIMNSLGDSLYDVIKK